MSRMSVLGASLLSAEAASSAIDTLSIDTKFCMNQRMNQHVGGIDQQCMSSTSSASSLLCKLEPRTSFDDDLSSFLESADIWMDCSSSSSGTSSNNDASEGEEAIVGGNHGLVFPINPVTPHYQSVGFYPRLPQLGRQLSDVSQSNGGAVMFTDYSSSPSSSSVASTASSPAMSPIGGGNYFAPFEVTANLNSIVDEEEDEAHNELNDARNSALDAMDMLINPLPDLALSDIDAILSQPSFSIALQPSSSSSLSSSQSMMSPIAASPSSYIMVKSEPIEMPVFKSEPCSPPASPFMYSSSPSSSASPVSSPESMSSGCSDFPSSPFDQSMSNFNKRYPNKNKTTTKISIKHDNDNDNKHPVRRTKDCLHVAEFLLSLLVIPEKYGKLIKWERKETGLFRILKPNDVANLWARTKSNKEHMDYPNMARGIRFAREKSGDFDQVTKEDGVGKKLVYKFSQRFRARNDILQKIMSPQQFEVRRKIKKEEIY